MYRDLYAMYLFPAPFNGLARNVENQPEFIHQQPE
jgi:hypothetical protein